jgi:hypothetical protein
MTSYSKGIALWIGVNVHDARHKLALCDLEKMINSGNISAVISKMLKAGDVNYLWQYPGKRELHLCFVYIPPHTVYCFKGMAVHSGLGDGSSHLVISLGTLIEQFAWNKSFSPEGLSRSLCFWDGCLKKDGNSAILNRTILPCLTLQSQGYPVGLADELRILVNKAQQAEEHSLNVVEWFPTGKWIEESEASPLIHGHCVRDNCLKLVEIASLNRDCFCQQQ